MITALLAFFREEDPEQGIQTSYLGIWEQKLDMLLQVMKTKLSSKTSLSLIQVTWCLSLSSEHLSLVSAGAMGKDC